jgi:hypothetical protein
MYIVFYSINGKFKCKGLFSNISDADIWAKENVSVMDYGKYSIG